MEHDHLQGEHTAAVVLNRTVVDSTWHFSTLCGSHFQRKFYIPSTDVIQLTLTLVIDLTSQLSCNVNGCLSVDS